MAPFHRDTIRNLRESLSMSQREFAAHLGVPQTTVNRWETGRTTPNAEYLGMMYDLANRHSQTFEPFADSTRPRERVQIAVEAAREWLRKSRGPRGKEREYWEETFRQMLAISAGVDRRLRPWLERAEEATSGGARELTEILHEVQRLLEEPASGKGGR